MYETRMQCEVYVALPWLRVGVDRVMHRAIGITLTGADSSTPLCTNQQCCYCSERDARFRLNFVLANQRAYRPCLYLHQWTSCLVVRGVIEAGYQHNTKPDLKCTVPFLSCTYNILNSFIFYMINRIESTRETGNHRNRAGKSLARSIDVHVGFHSRYKTVFL